MSCRLNCIWSYWDQGEAAAPELVQDCWQSWRQHNRGVRLEILDRNSISRYSDLDTAIDLSRSDITVQKISNLLRLDLLSKHGGLWADATVFCTAPLESWLPDCADAGFFAFRNPGPDRLLSSWFLYADPSNALIGEYAARYRSLFQDYRYTRQNTASGRFIRKGLSRIFTKRVTTNRYWVEKPWPGLLKTFPYFQLHYTFHSIVLGNADMAEIWRRVPYKHADGPHFLSHNFRDAGEIQASLDFIENRGSPVHKLDWRQDTQSDYWRAVLPALKQA